MNLQPPVERWKKSYPAGKTWMKPALEKFMKEAGFIKKEEIEPLKRRIAELESEVAKLKS